MALKTKKVLVEVQQKHIDAGCRYRSMECPIALALREEEVQKQLPFVYRNGAPSVGSTHTVFGSTGGQYAFLPESAQEFVIRYDNSAPVEPFSFWLECRYMEGA